MTKVDGGDLWVNGNNTALTISVPIALLREQGGGKWSSFCSRLFAKHKKDPLVGRIKEKILIYLNQTTQTQTRNEIQGLYKLPENMHIPTALKIHKLLNNESASKLYHSTLLHFEPNVNFNELTFVELPNQREGLFINLFSREMRQNDAKCVSSSLDYDDLFHKDQNVRNDGLKFSVRLTQLTIRQLAPSPSLPNTSARSGSF